MRTSLFIMMMLAASLTDAAETGGAVGDQRRWMLNFDVRLEQPGGGRPIEIHLSGDWISTVTAVRHGEYDAALEMADAHIAGSGFRMRRFWATYRDDGALLAVHFFK